ncbi:LacI family DNA-binding transcriptional regulator [Arthrobacter monumenti]
MNSTDPARRPTIYDVAQAAGVSKSLVSLVLQKSSKVSQTRRKAVERAIAELGYRPSQAASFLAGSETRTIGVVLDDFRNLWFVELLRGLQRELEPNGFRIAVVDTHLNAHVETNPLDGFLALRVDGIVIAAEPTEAMLNVKGVPVVVAGSRERTVPDSDIVANDDLRGGRLATQHLLDLGHRMIGHVTGAGRAGRLREQGYSSLMDSSGLVPRIAGSGGATTEAAGYESAMELLDSWPELTAVFAANDTMAMGVMAAIHEHGRRVPEDFSLVGYDNSPLASTRLLRLTTIDGQSERVGSEAAHYILSRIGNQGTGPREKFVEPELVLRSSTAELKA